MSETIDHVWSNGVNKLTAVATVTYITTIAAANLLVAHYGPGVAALDQYVLELGL